MHIGNAVPETYEFWNGLVAEGGRRESISVQVQSLHLVGLRQILRIVISVAVCACSAQMASYFGITTNIPFQTRRANAYRLYVVLRMGSTRARNSTVDVRSFVVVHSSPPCHNLLLDKHAHRTPVSTDTI